MRGKETLICSKEIHPEMPDGKGRLDNKCHCDVTYFVIYSFRFTSGFMQCI